MFHEDNYKSLGRETNTLGGKVSIGYMGIIELFWGGGGGGGDGIWMGSSPLKSPCTDETLKKGPGLQQTRRGKYFLFVLEDKGQIKSYDDISKRLQIIYQPTTIGRTTALPGIYQV